MFSESMFVCLASSILLLFVDIGVKSQSCDCIHVLLDEYFKKSIMKSIMKVYEKAYPSCAEGLLVSSQQQQKKAQKTL